MIQSGFIGFMMRQVTVDARDKNNRAKQFKVLTTILNESIDGKQIGDLFERRWEGEVDIRSIKCTMQRIFQLRFLITSLLAMG